MVSIAKEIRLTLESRDLSWSVYIDKYAKSSNKHRRHAPAFYYKSARRRLKYIKAIMLNSILLTIIHR